MSRNELTISQAHAAELRSCLFPANGHEAGTLILCGISSILVCPWTGESICRYLSREVIPIPFEDVVSSSPRHFEWAKRTFLMAYKRARDEGLAIAFVHSHRRIHAFFSTVDDKNDQELAELVSHRRGPRPPLLSIVMDDTGGDIAARVCDDVYTRFPLDKTAVLGSLGWKWAFSHALHESDAKFQRQELAFGPGFLDVLPHLKITVVGAGATGSCTSHLLLRLGAKFLSSIDPDVVDYSNLSRIQSSRVSDAKNSVPKVDVIARDFRESEFEVKFHGYQKLVTDVEVRDVLKASDIIFCCTDDDEGRLFLNRFSYFYNTPVIDMGIKIDPVRIRENHIRLADGRVTVVSPGMRCLVCRRIADPTRARVDFLRRVDPDAYHDQVREGYIVNEFVAAPSVVTFTTSVAGMAVDELTARLTEYRSPGDHWLRKFANKRDHSPGAKEDECGICCRANWGRGDVVPFLNRVG